MKRTFYAKHVIILLITLMIMTGFGNTAAAEGNIVNGEFTDTFEKEDYINSDEKNGLLRRDLVVYREKINGIILITWRVNIIQWSGIQQVKSGKEPQHHRLVI